MTANLTLRTLAEEFVLYKQRIGYAYGTHGQLLMRYVTHAEVNFSGIVTPNKNSVNGFLYDISNSTGTLYNAMSAIREFGKYLSIRGYKDTYVIPPKSSPVLDPEPPYFFTSSEIKLFFETCDTVQPNNNYPGRELVLPALFRVLYCCGLRCKEARTLLCENMRLKDGFFDVMQSKGPKSRRIYISDELSEYLLNYDSSIHTLFPTGRKCFFPSRNDTFYGSGVVSNNFNRFWSEAFPNFPLTSRPRAYDFRHHFVWENLNRWAKEGLDMNVMLPYLARYMGHQHIKSTLYYFRFVPDFFPVFADMVNPLEAVLPEVPYEED